MGINLEVYGICRMVYEALDDVCAHFFTGKRSDRLVHGRLNIVLMVETCQGEGLYLIMDREGDDVCAMAWYSIRSPTNANPVARQVGPSRRRT